MAPCRHNGDKLPPIHRHEPGAALPFATDGRCHGNQHLGMISNTGAKECLFSVAILKLAKPTKQVTARRTLFAVLLTLSLPEWGTAHHKWAIDNQYYQLRNLGAMLPLPIR